MTLIGSVTRMLVLLVLIAFLALLALTIWMWKEQRSWVVSRAVDTNACTDTHHEYLKAAAPRASRELFRANNACQTQIVRMLRSAPNFSCHRSQGVTVCEHALNADDDTTYARAVLKGNVVLLETIPT